MPILLMSFNSGHFQLKVTFSQQNNIQQYANLFYLQQMDITMSYEQPSLTILLKRRALTILGIVNNIAL